jgi:hypothetical protein
VLGLPSGYLMGVKAQSTHHVRIEIANDPQYSHNNILPANLTWSPALL